MSNTDLEEQRTVINTETAKLRELRTCMRRFEKPAAKIMEAMSSSGIRVCAEAKVLSFYVHPKSIKAFRSGRPEVLWVRCNSGVHEIDSGMEYKLNEKGSACINRV